MVLREQQDGVALIQVNNPPVNTLNSGVAEAIEEAIDAAQADKNVKAMVLMGAGKTFVAGADIKELEDRAWGRGSGAPNLHKLLAKIEDSVKPVFMAIHGAALGGGLELALAGHYRVASNDAQVGQPEVNLGVIPGAEGTQRLPRLIGVEKAIEICVSGKPLTAQDALSTGILDAIVEGDLRSEAVAYANRIVRTGGPHRKTRERQARLKSGASLDDALAAGRALADKIGRNMVAPLKVLEAIRGAATLPFEQGCAREQKLFTECVNSEQCRALIHAFFAERAVAKVRGLPQDKTVVSSVERVAIVGAGTMGSGIAMACANAGLTVLLTDVRQEGLEAGLAAIRKNYDVSIKRGRFTPEIVTECVARIKPQLDLVGFETADLVIEAVFEDMQLKCSVFEKFDRIVKPGCILASNTSTLDIDELAGVTNRSDRVVGLHFFSPANVMRLLEIVRGRSTSLQTISAALAVAKRLKKVGVVVSNGPGFVGNRMMFPYMYESQFLVEEGATPQQVDSALKGFGMAMGMFEVDDMAGLDVSWRVRREMRHFSELGVRQPLVAEHLHGMGRFGQKTGRGWYVYSDDRKPMTDPDVLSLIRSLSAKAGIPQRQFTNEEIVERSLYNLINEGARVLEEGRTARASDIDVIYVNGYGFPAWRGGPMFYADSVGLKNIVKRILDFEREHGPRWKVAPLLHKLAQTNGTFREWDKERAS
jgi:3-hydroxyacyl-CoA dehydrogenase